MITKRDRDKIKEIIPHYVEAVQAIMREKKIYNRRGLVYGPQIIRDVFNGRRSNPRIETAIYLAYYKMLDELQTAKEAAKKIMDDEN